MNARDNDAAAPAGGAAKSSSPSSSSSVVGEAVVAAAQLEGAEKRKLPYGGDLQAAMKAQDRPAIRILMNARDNPG